VITAIIDRLDKAILDVINNPVRNQKTSSIGTLFLEPLYVNDLIDGLVRLMNTPDEVTGPVNMGNPAIPLWNLPNRL
jgi:nucleoside-diphosphate-sugar epimerase